MDVKDIEQQMASHLEAIRKAKDECESKVKELNELTKMTWHGVEIEGRRARVAMTPDNKILIHFEFKDDAEKFYKGLIEQ